VCRVSHRNKDKDNLWKLVLERGEFMPVQRVDHLAVQNFSLHPCSTNIRQLLYSDLLLREYFIYIYICIANLIDTRLFTDW